MKPVSVDPTMTARAALLNSTATILHLHCGRSILK